MNYHYTLLRTGAWRIAAGVVVAFFMQCANAQQSVASVEELIAHYPKGSISEVGQAERALAEVQRTRSLIESQFRSEQQECYPKFFATKCIDAAKERRRVSMEKVAPIEVEATQFQRKAKVVERDKALAEKKASEQAGAGERLIKQQESEKTAKDKAAQRERQAVEQKAKEKSVPGGPSRVEQHEAHMKQLQEEEQRKAPEREKNVAAYNEKVKKAQEDQRKVQEKKKQKAAEQEKRKQAVTQ